MNLATAYDSIAAVEERFPVEALRLNGANVWLPARDIFIRPFFDHRLLTYGASVRALSHTDPLDWHAIRDRDLAFERRPAYRHHTVGGLGVFNKHGASYQTMGYAEPVDILVFHAFTDYGEAVNRRVFNRVSDGLVELYPDKSRALKIMRTTPTAPLLPYYNSVHFYVEPNEEYGLHDPLPDEGPFLRLLEEIVAWARQQSLPIVYEREAIMNRLRTMFWRANSFTGLIRYFGPRAIYLSSYSNAERTAMTLAGWREGIPVADVEHGFMGPFSPYGRLRCIGAKGVSVLPRYFWCWGTESRDFIKGSLPPEGSAHIPIIGGSTWHRARAKLVREGVLQEERPAELPLDFRRRLTDAARVVYFCWQPDMLLHNAEPSLLPPHFLKAAGAAPSDVLFCLRLHPRSHHLMGHFARLLDRHGIHNYEIEHSTRYPLLDILPLTHVMVTSYSTVAFEANALSIPVIVVDEFGSRMMADFVNRGIFRACLSAGDLLDAMVSLGPSDAPTVDYISDDPAAHLNAFREIAHNGLPAG